MITKWSKIAILLLLLLFIALAILFYTKVYIPKSTYDYIMPETTNMPIKISGIGEVDAKEIYPINSQVTGKILSLTKDQGDWIKRGEIIAQLDPVDLPIQLESAKIAEKKALLQIKVSKENLSSLEAKYKLLQATYNRTYKLYKQKFASQAEYDKVKSDLDSIKAQIRSAQVQIESTKIELQRTGKNIEALEKKLQLFTIKSPIDGYVITKNAQVAQTVLPSVPIITLVDPKSVWVKVYIDEHISGKVKVGQPAIIMLRSRPAKPFSAKVARIESQSDPVTEERIVDITFDKIPMPFYIKERAEATIITGNVQNALQVPIHTLVQKEGEMGVWIEKKNRAHFVPVELLTSDDKFTAVKGITQKDKVLIPSPNKKPLKEGVRVHL